MFPFCRVNGQKFQALTTTLNPAYEYAVLSLSPSCPSGSVQFWRHFDTEDGNNASSAAGDRSRYVASAGVSPNYLDTSLNVRMFFCMFRFSGTPMARFPDLSQPYGVFAPSDFALAIQRGWVYTDDEDTNTGNGYGSPFPAESQRIVSDGNNTDLFLSQVGCWPGSPSSAGQACGSCGGRVQCDGSCSVATPVGFGQVCGSCGGRILCDGSCSVATPVGFGQACGCGGTVLCSGSCSKTLCPTGQQCSGGLCKVVSPPPPPSGCLPAGSDCAGGTCCKGCNIKLQICRA
jgi:hypothetical protein